MSKPTGMDQLDPAPRRPRYHRGDAELAVLRDLRAMPSELRKSAIAAAALLLARQLDQGIPVPRDDGRLAWLPMTPRDAAGHAREIRMCMTQLREWNPAGEAGDKTDEARHQVEHARSLYAVPDGTQS